MRASHGFARFIVALLNGVRSTGLAVVGESWNYPVLFANPNLHVRGDPRKASHLTRPSVHLPYDVRYEAEVFIAT